MLPSRPNSGVNVGTSISGAEQNMQNAEMLIEIRRSFIICQQSEEAIVTFSSCDDFYTLVYAEMIEIIPDQYSVSV